MGTLHAGAHRSPAARIAGGVRAAARRARRMGARGSRRLGGWVARTGRAWSRPVLRPVDRRRSPTVPCAVVVEPTLDADAMATQGRAARFAGAHPRFATCTGAVWTRADRLVSAFLLGESLVTYAWSPGPEPSAERRGLIAGIPSMGEPTNIDCAPDGRWLAFADSGFGGVAVLPIDPETGDPVPEIVATTAVPGDRVMHAVAFAPDGRFVLFTCIGRHGGIRVARFHGDAARGEARLAAPTVADTTYWPSVPKALAFSPDGRFVAVGYAENAGSDSARPTAPSFVEVHRWDPETGTVREVVGRSPRSWGIGAIEDVAWLPGGDRLLLTDQFRDQALFASVDPLTGEPGEVVDRIGWAAGGLRMPHGCAVSPDGRTVLVTNYGDGSVRFFPTPGTE